MQRGKHCGRGETEENKSAQTNISAEEFSKSEVFEILQKCVWFWGINLIE